jgi:hypothetical protein
MVPRGGLAVSDRAARTLLVLVALGLLGATLSVNLPSVDRFWSDGATYHAMAWSLAEDGDLRYEVKDLLRVKREFPVGPQGVFLKKSSGALTLKEGFPFLSRVPESEPRLYYAKAFVYPAVAAPFVRLFGTRGLLLTNVLFFDLALFLAYGELRRQAGPASSLALALVLLLASVTPVYLLWLTPEIFNLGLIVASLAAWRRGHPVPAAMLLGLATYSKPTNILLALPLVVDPLVEGPLASRIGEAARRGGILLVTVFALFGLNAALTGEWNYQGGERKTFDGHYPLESQEATFDTTGFVMTTEHLGPTVAGRDAADRSGPPLKRSEIREAFLRNLGYFWVGRFGGALLYDFPVALAAGVFLLAGPRTRVGWLGLASLLLSYVVYIWLIPANWYGGGAALGNRYFVNLLPLALLLVPRGREALLAGVGFLVSALLLGGILSSPLEHSLHPGDHGTHAPFLSFPLEITELNDLSVFMEAWRKKRPFGDTEGRGHPADPAAYYLYFPDNGTRGKEAAFGGEGFVVKKRAEVVLRSLEPLRRLTFRLHGGSPFSIRVPGESRTVELREGEERQEVFEMGPGFPYYGTFLYVLHFRGEDVFVQIALEPLRDR